MSGVMGYGVARRDIRLIRGDSHRVGAHWRRRDASGVVTPVDVTDMTGVVELRGPSGELWFTAPTDVMTTDGYALATLSPDAFAAGEWAGRVSGQWRVTVTNKDKTDVRTLAWGYWHMSD